MNDDYFSPTHGRSILSLKTSDDNHPNNYSRDSTDPISNFATSFSFQTVLELIHGALVGSTFYLIFSQDNTNSESNDDSDYQDDITIAGIVKRLALQEGKMLDEKRNITFKMVCCTFLLQLLCCLFTDK